MKIWEKFLLAGICFLIFLFLPRVTNDFAGAFSLLLIVYWAIPIAGIYFIWSAFSE